MMCAIYIYIYMSEPKPSPLFTTSSRAYRSACRPERAKKLSAHLHDDERKNEKSGVCITEDEDAGPEDAAAVLLALSAIGAAV